MVIISGVPIFRIFMVPKNNHNCPTNGTVWLFSAAMYPNYTDRIINSVDSDQTAPFGAG